MSTIPAGSSIPLARQPASLASLGLVLVAILACWGCDSLVPTPSPTPTASATPAPDATPEALAAISWGSTAQEIDGFGTSTAWGSVPADANLDAFFSTTSGAGLSILRNRIPFRENATYDDRFVKKVGETGSSYTRNADYAASTNPDGTKTYTLNWNNWDLAATRNLISKIKAKGSDYGVSRIFSTPWTPPNNAVSNWKVQSGLNSLVDPANAPERGGMLAMAHYADYADLLADYANGFAANMGMELYGLSLQNEPNWVCSYESADWTASQFHDFTAVLQAEFSKKQVSPGLKVIAPEDPNFKEDLILPTLADSATASRIDIVAAHQYEVNAANALSYQPPVFSTTHAQGKRLWMTEWSTAAFTDNSGHELFTIDPALVLARVIHLDLVCSQANAFMYWWCSLLVDGSGTPAPQLGVLGQYSRIIRPGWFRVEAVADPLGNGKVLVSAFRNPGSTEIALVAINLDTASHHIGFTLDGGKVFAGIQGYRTAAGALMAALDGGASQAEGGSSLKRILPARSVSTWHGRVE